MTVVRLPCGTGSIPLHLPAAAAGRVRVLATRPDEPLADPEGAVRRALAEPLGSPPLGTLARGRSTACIVVSDTTRPVPNRVLLPPLLEALGAAGVPRDRVTVLVATGMHPPVPAADLAEHLGTEVVGACRVIQHDCRDRANLRRVTDLEGAPVEIHRAYLDAELQILTGLIEPHGFAGFSGGAKSVAPGLASFDTMRFLHSYALVEHPGVATARLDGNPFRRYLDQIVRATGDPFLVNVTQDRDRRLTGVWAGDVDAAFRAGCAHAAAHSVVRVERPADLVVTTGGGAPLDATLYQATKGLFGALELVRPGGTVLWVAGCGQGAGSPAFAGLIRAAAGDPAAFRARHADPARFVVDQWAAQAYFQVLERAGRVLLHSPHLDPAEVAAWGLAPAADPDATFRRLLAGTGEAIVVPEGPHLAAVAAP